MSELADWRRTSSYERPEGHGIVVELNGQLGYAKLGNIEHEKLGADLGRLVRVPVSRVEIGLVEGHGPFAISHIHGQGSHVLATKNERVSQHNSPAVRDALKTASGLLPFLAWIAADDHHDDTNLVVDDLGNGILRVAAFDFEDAFGWTSNEEAITFSAPPALVTNIDHLLVCEHLSLIETLTAAQISDCCAVFDNRPELGKRIALGLQRRQGLLRTPLAERGWIV